MIEPNTAERTLPHLGLGDVLQLIARWHQSEIARLASEAIADLTTERTNSPMTADAARAWLADWTRRAAFNTWPERDDDEDCDCSEFAHRICRHHGTPRVKTLGPESSGECACLWLAATKWCDPFGDDGLVPAARYALRQDVLGALHRRAAEWEHDDDRGRIARPLADE